jgi:hypothetical protein
MSQRPFGTQFSSLIEAWLPVRYPSVISACVAEYVGKPVQLYAVSDPLKWPRRARAETTSAKAASASCSTQTVKDSDDAGSSDEASDEPSVQCCSVTADGSLFAGVGLKSLAVWRPQQPSAAQLQRALKKRGSVAPSLAPVSSDAVGRMMERHHSAALTCSVSLFAVRPSTSFARASRAPAGGSGNLSPSSAAAFAHVATPLLLTAGRDRCIKV